MAHFAKLNSENIVTRVEVISNNEAVTEQDGINFLKSLYGEDTIWKQTSYNTMGGVHYQDNLKETPSEDQSKAFRKNYAAIGFTYDESRDAFIPPKHFESWILNETSCLYEAPIEYPGTWGQDPKYIWNEEDQSWEDYPSE